MNVALIAALVAIFCALIAVFASARSSGPRITTIETRTSDDEKTGE